MTGNASSAVRLSATVGIARTNEGLFIAPSTDARHHGTVHLGPDNGSPPR